MLGTLKENVKEEEKIITVTDDNGDSYEYYEWYSFLDCEFLNINERIINMKKEEAVKYYSKKLKQKLKKMLETKEKLIEILEQEKEAFIRNLYEVLAEMKEHNFDVETSIRKYQKYLEYEHEFQKYNEVLAEMKRAYEEVNKSNERDMIEQRLYVEFKEKYKTTPDTVLKAKKDNAVFFLAIDEDIKLVKEREFTKEEEAEFLEYIDSLKKYYETKKYLNQLVEIDDNVYLINMRKAVKVKYSFKEMKYFENDVIHIIEFEEVSEEEYRELFKKFLRKYHTHYIEIKDFEVKNDLLVLTIDDNEKGRFIGCGGRNIKEFTETLREIFKNEKLKVVLK